MVRPVGATPPLPPSEPSRDPKQEFLKKLDALLSQLDSIDCRNKGGAIQSLQAVMTEITKLKEIPLPNRQYLIHDILDRANFLTSFVVQEADLLTPEQFADEGPRSIATIKNALESIKPFLNF